MTTPAAPYDDTKLRQALRIYADHPLDDGDVVLLLDDSVCVELEQLADTWDVVLRRSTGQVLRETARRAAVAIVRPDAVLRPSDFQLWRDLHEELRGSDVELLPVRALPAA